MGAKQNVGRFMMFWLLEERKSDTRSAVSYAISPTAVVLNEKHKHSG
jgi:hypothetical protein